MYVQTYMHAMLLWVCSILRCAIWGRQLRVAAPDTRGAKTAQVECDSDRNAKNAMRRTSTYTPALKGLGFNIPPALLFFHFLQTS